MGKFLKALLDADEPLFSATLRQLETLTGHKAVDISYIADITARAHAVMRQIGLDPADTSEFELYKALSAHAQDAHLFARTDDVGLIFGRDRVISFNHDDILENAQRAYELRTARHMRCQVRHGLTARYVNADGDNGIAIRDLVAEGGLNTCDLVDYHEQKAASRQTSEAPYILCIGDIFTDVFIKLLEGEARIDTDKDGSKRLSLPFGKKPPYDSAEVIHSVGPSPNAAVGMSRLGARVGLMSWLGDDKTSKDSLAYLAHEHVDVQSMIVQKNTPSSTYYVLRYGADRTILVKNEDYEYVWHEPTVKPDWIYLSLISADSWPLHLALADYLERNPDIKFALQPGTFHFKWGVKKMARLYKRADIVVMNREEAMETTGKGHDVIRQLANGLHALGPELVVITDGPERSYASYDGRLVIVPNYPDPAPPLDRTGAGDAFASSVVAALALGKTFDEALAWAPINSMSVIQKLGAQAGLLRQDEIRKYLEKAPIQYKLEEYTK